MNQVQVYIVKGHGWIVFKKYVGSLLLFKVDLIEGDEGE